VNAAIRIAAVVVGLVFLTLVVAGLADSHDNTDQTVRADRWADDVCGTVAAWEGQLEAIGDDVAESNVGAREHDGGSGDEVEATAFVRTAVDRSIDATQDTLQEGLKRAGIPDTAQGAQASLALRQWAQQTEDDLNRVQNAFEDGADAPASSFALLAAAVASLERSLVQGRATVAQIGAADPELADALTGSRTCQRLVEDQP